MIDLSLSLLKHSDIREEIKSYLKEKYDITYTDGSNFNYIVEFLSILNMMMSYQLTNVAKNMTLSAVNDRNIAVDLAQKLGYNPKLKTPSKMVGSFKLVATAALTSIEITNIQLAGNDLGYTYLVDDILYDADTMTQPSDYLVGDLTYEFPFIAEQIEARTITTKITEAEPFVYINSDKLAEHTIAVNVDTDDWTNFNNFDNVPSTTDTVFFTNEDVENKGKLYVRFGNGIIGAEPSTEDEIIVTYYITEGVEGNGETELAISNMSITTNLGTQPTQNDFSITDLSFSYCGKDNETIDEIKVNAPRFFNTKNRLVSKTDYESVLSSLEETDVKYFSIIDMYSRDNLEYFYKLGNIYLSMVPSSIYSTEFTTNSMYTKNQTLAVEDIDTLNITSQSVEDSINAFEDNFIISTNRVYVSPSYLYTDIQPKLELVNKNYSIGLIGNDILPTFKTYSEEIEGLDKDFRSDEIIDMIMDDDRVKSTDLIINYSLLTNKTNLLGTKKLNVPSVIVTTNKKARNIDNTYLGYSYDYNSMPDSRKSIYGTLKQASATLFDRYITMDTFYNTMTASKTTTFYIKPVINTAGTSIDFSDYQFDAQTINLSDDSIGEILVKTTSDIPNYVEDGDPAIFFVDGQDAYNLSYYAKETGDEFFIYFKRGLNHYLLGTINLLPNGTTDYDVTINYNFTQTGNDGAITELFNLYDISMVKNKPFIPIIDNTYNIPYDTTKYNNTKIELYILNNANTETSTEFIKIRSYKPIGTLGVDANNSIKITNVQTPFTAVNADGDLSTNELLNVSVGNTVVLALKRDLISGDIQLDESTKADYPTGYETYKNQEFAIIGEVLYCYETIDDVIIGYFDRYNNKIVFNDFVNVSNVMVKLDTFFTTYSVIDDSDVYQINLRKDFTINNNTITYVQDFDSIGGVCCLYNFRRPTTL